MTYINSIQISPNPLTLTVGEWYHDIEVTYSPSTADCKCVTWHSDDPTVVAVSQESGYFYAVATGTTKVYAIACDGSGVRGECTVTVREKVLVSSVSLDRTSVLMEAGKTLTLTPTIAPSDATNQELLWQSTNRSVARVSDGTITALAEGTTTITATARDDSGVSASCQVTVTNDVLVTSINITPNSRTIVKGDTTSFITTVTPANATNKGVIWTSNNPLVVKVNPNSGLITGRDVGTATIYATALDGSGTVGECTVTVENPILVTSIEFEKSNLKLFKGQRYALSATVLPENATNQTIRWSSSKQYVVSVDPNTGCVTVIGDGDAEITAEAQDGSGVKAICNITVKVAHITPSERKLLIKIGETMVADPIDTSSGAHQLTNTIMSLFGGQSLKLVASYDSTLLVPGSMGTGWRHNYEKHIEVCEDEAYVYYNPATYAIYVSDNSNNTSFHCTAADKNGYILTIDHTVQYPYILNCNHMWTEHYDENGKLAKIVDHQGFETLISDSGSLITITDTISGKKIYLRKNSEGKVIRVYDDEEREATLTYTGDFLTAICDINGNTLTYTYDEEGRVKTGTDSKGVCYFENTYDEYGRVIEQKDAITGSLKSKITYDGNKRIVIDRNGKESIREYNELGLLSHYTDENGNSQSYEYDEHCNVTKITDAKGNSTIKTYNSFNKPTQITDKNGKTTYISYDESGNVVSILYPTNAGSAPSETFSYNTRNQVTQHTDIRNTVTVYGYDENHMPATKKVGSKPAIQYTYQNGLLKSQTDARGKTTSYAHNTIGQLTSVTDADNKTTSYEYDASGNLLRTVDANGKSILITYDGNYQKTSETDANGNKTEYTYNGNMKNTSVLLPDGNTIRYEYDGEDRPVKTIDQANNITSVTYDNGGRMITKQFADGGTVRYEYDTVGNVTKETGPEGGVTTKTYDNLGNVLTVTDDAGNVTTYEYNAMSQVTKVTNAQNGTTVYEYSLSGDLLSETDPMGNEKSYTYDEFGNRLTLTDARNNVTTYTYDANNNLLTVKDPLDHTTTYAYDSLNRCISVTDHLNHTIRYGYDALGRRTTITDAKNNVFTTFYDNVGNVIKTTDAKGNTISETTYNALNLPLTVTDSMGKTTTYTYNAIGKVASVTDPLHHQSEYTYNARGQNTAVLDAANGTSTATYDLMGNITRLAGPLGGATTYTYDDMGRLLTESTVSGGTHTYTYNALNLKATLTNARNQTKQFTYDAAGRIISATSPEGTTTYTYDANSNVLSVTDPSGTVTRTYDELNRVASMTDTYQNTISYEYDAVGNLSRVTYPDNTAVSYAYDENHNLTRVTDWANRVTSYTYDVNNRVIGVTKPDGSVTETVYDNMQRVTSTVERTATGSVITGFSYTYDDLSRVTEEVCLANSTKLCYTYDELSRVTKRTLKNSADVPLSEENFTYDAAGNITAAEDDTFVYDVNNRLTSHNGTAVTYDMDGNMLSSGTTTFTYDSSNRLLTAGGHTYTYNGENVRVKDLCGGVETTFVYDTNAKLSRLLVKTTGGTVTKYVYGRGLIGEESGNVFKTYHFDSRGSTVAITNLSGIIIDTFQYDTYGKLISRTGTSSVIFLYNGRDGVVTDSNGLIYMRARYYSPSLRRFINADIIPGEISNAITLNRYAYANGNPVSFVDPLGLSVERGNGQPSTIYDNKYYNSKALKKIKSNSEYIIYYSKLYGVDPNIVAGVIFVEQYYNYDWKDELTDWFAFYGVDTSVGLGQVRLSTAKYLEKNGYVPKTSAKEGGWKIPFLGFVHGTETMAREKRLENNQWNVMYVAAYIKAIEDYWEDAYPQIGSDPAILGTLYNIGHDKTKPHGNPKPGPFGEKVDYFYDLMEEILHSEEISGAGNNHYIDNSFNRNIVSVCKS